MGVSTVTDPAVKAGGCALTTYSGSEGALLVESRCTTVGRCANVRSLPFDDDSAMVEAPVERQLPGLRTCLVPAEVRWDG